MKYNIYINQKGLEKDKEITITDASVIDWLYTFAGTSNRKINANKVDGFTWINLTFLIEDMPLLRIKTKSGASKLLTRLEKLGYIKLKKEPRKLMYRPTEKMDSLYLSNELSERVSTSTLEVSPETQTVSHRIQDSIPQETYHNTNNIILDTNTRNIIDDFIKEQKITSDVTLPTLRGKTKYERVTSIYSSLFKDKFNISAKLNFKNMSKSLKPLLDNYSEVQVAYLLVVYFNWRGMNDNDNKEEQFLINSTYSINLFASGVTKYEIYARNILKVNLDDDVELLENLNDYFTEMYKRQYTSTKLST